MKIHLHFVILKKVGKKFEHGVRAYLSLYSKFAYTCARRIGLATAQAKVQTKNRIRQLFSDDPRMSLCAAAAEESVAHATIWNFDEKN